MPGVSFHLALDARKLTDFGIGTYVSHLLRGLGEHEEIRLTGLCRPEHEERITALVPHARVVPVSARGYTVAEHISLPMALWREKVDLVHIPHYVVPFGLRRPVVSTVHDVIQLFYPPERKTNIGLLYLRTVMNATLRRSRRVITVSRTSRRDLIRLFNADEGKLKVVPNGVDPELETRPPADVLQELKERFDLKPPLLLVVSNDKPHKNLDTALRAFHLGLRTHGLPGQLVFVGGMRPDGRLARKVSGLGLENRVRFLGRVSQNDLHNLYHLSAVLLHIALYEGFGFRKEGVKSMAAKLNGRYENCLIMALFLRNRK